MAESDVPSVHVDVVSDVVCPWCYIGKRRLEMAVALTPEIAVEVNWRPYFLNQWIPREGIDRQTYLETKFGSPDATRPSPSASPPRPRSRGSPSPSTRSAASRTPSTVTASSFGRAAPPIPAR